jgi:putative intracellular protease/amidase
MANVLLPLPDHDFDVTEVAVPFTVLTRRGHRVLFATETGAVPAADPLLLSGVLFGQLGAEPEAKRWYAEMVRHPAFLRTTPFADVDVAAIDALLLPGGHAQGMRPYLESAALRALVLAIWKADKPVGAICHGTLVLARTLDPATGRSVLSGKRTTCLPAYMERTAYFLTAWKLGGYYRTYPAYVEDEVRAALARPEDFVRGPIHLVRRGTDTDDGPAFLVEDGAYLSARWPGDAYAFAKRFAEKIETSSPG